ncbi:MAG: efflux RND transporter periplasmic adaptor subunit [Methylocystis sp.]
MKTNIVCIQRRFPSALILLGLAILSSGALLGCGKSKNDADTEADRPVLAEPAHLTAQGQLRDFVATVRPRVESDLGFRVLGKVVKRYVQVGQRVKLGDPLALLDEKDLRLQKEQAEAEHAAAKMALAQAAGDEQRTLTLHKDGWTAQAAVDRVRAAAQEARGRLQRAERALELSGNSLDYATLRADHDGVVTATLVEPGQVVAAGQTAIRVAHTDELEAAVSLPEDFSQQAAQGIATLTLWSNKSKHYPAKLRELSPTADAQTRTFAARYSILDPDSAIALGMSATLEIALPGAQQIARVPLSALFNQGGGPALWKVDADNRVQLLPVKVVRYETDSAYVTGVKEGDQIVLLGVHKLEAGRKVRLIGRLI